MKNKKFLTPEIIYRETAKRTKKYQRMNFLESYSMYMGVAQLLELRLKRLLVDRHGVELDKTEKWTLGATCTELKRKNLKEDFIMFLENVVASRNYIAHDLLANEFIYLAILENHIPKGHYTKNYRILHKAIIELEQLNYLFEWTEENNGW